MITHCPVVRSKRNCDSSPTRPGNGLRSSTGAGQCPGNAKNSRSRPSASFARIGEVTTSKTILAWLGRRDAVRVTMCSPVQTRGQEITVLYERAHNWAIGSDPGLLRLRMALRTMAALACSLAALFLL